VLTYGAKLLLVPTLVAVGLLGLLAFVVCRALIGACVRSQSGEDAAA
jgi:hypothetical protein